MSTGLLHLHNLLRWVILILLVLSIFKAYTGWKGNKVFSASDKKIWLFTLIASHITLLLGLFQWYKFPTVEGVSVMKDPYMRFFKMEHPVSMILAILLITLGYGMAKKNVEDAVKFKKAFRYFLLALILILVMVPWPYKALVGRPLFPGM